MKLSHISENDVTRRDFLKRGVATVASTAFNPLKLLLSSGLSPAVITGLQAGKTLPFLMTAVANHGRGAPPKLSTLFYNIHRVSTISRSLSNTGLIAGYDDSAMIGGEIGLDKLAHIIKAANDGSIINLAGYEFKAQEDNTQIYLSPLRNTAWDGRTSRYSGGPEIKIFKDPDYAAEMFSLEHFTGNPIQKIWDDYLKFGGTHIDQAAKEIIDKMGLDMSQIPIGERSCPAGRHLLRAYRYEEDYEYEPVAGRLLQRARDERRIGPRAGAGDDADTDTDSTEDEEVDDTEPKPRHREYHGSMHQAYEDYQKKLDKILV